MVISRARLEEVDELIEAKLEGALLHAALDSLLGEKALLVLEVEDTLFDRFGDSEFVDDDIDGLCQAMNTIDCLFLDELISKLAYWTDKCKGECLKTYRVPERLKDNNSCRGRKV